MAIDVLFWGKSLNTYLWFYESELINYMTSFLLHSLVLLIFIFMFCLFPPIPLGKSKYIVLRLKILVATRTQTLVVKKISITATVAE